MASKNKAYQGKPRTQIKINVQNLNVRKGAGLDYDVVKIIHAGDTCYISQQNNGWGKLSDNSGWVLLDYVTIV